MATRTFGTTTTTVLTAVAFNKQLLDADVATIQQGIKDDRIAAAGSHPIYAGDAFSKQGLLYIPNRGVLQVLDGDYVCIDNNGWPILVSANSIGYGSTNWAHS
jgi:hypothetical protein